MRLLLIDNHDSFTAILHHYAWEAAGERPLFYRNDELTRDELERLDFEAVILSPGPGHPAQVRDFGVGRDLLALYPDVPVLGVCLGMQGLAYHAGARVVPWEGALHGRPSRITHDGTGVFRGVPDGFSAIRYHSLHVDPASLPAHVRVTARSREDDLVMGIAFTDRPWHGVQFHPESFATEYGKTLIANFIDLARADAGVGLRSGPAAGDVAPWAAATSVENTPEAARDAPRLDSARTGGDVPGGPRLAPPETAGRTIPHRLLRWREPADVFVSNFHNVTNSFWMRGGAWGAEVMGRAAEAHVFRDWNAWRAWVDALPLAEGRAAPWEGYRGGPVGHLPYEGYRGTLSASGVGGVAGIGGRAAPVEESDRAGGGNAAGEEPFRWLLPAGWLAFDQATRTVHAAWEGEAPPEWLEDVIARWDEAPPPLPSAELPPFARWAPSLDEHAYRARVVALQDAIARGETYEACLTHAFTVTGDGDGSGSAPHPDPLTVFLRLCARNPASYAAYLAFEDVNILSASPELFLEARDGIVRSFPIKGTRRRGRDAESDDALREDLAGSVKDAAENRMIVDLTRHDLARVCEPGSVDVPVFLRVEALPAVFQLVSEVQGRLKPGATATDAIGACFPGGSMTGAPKERTVGILSALEAAPRGIYSGALGYLTYGHAFRLSMVIRTLENRGAEWRVGCGGAVLADSDPSGEWREAMLKARSVIDAAGGVAGSTGAPSRPDVP